VYLDSNTALDFIEEARDQVKYGDEYLARPVTREASYIWERLVSQFRLADEPPKRPETKNRYLGSQLQFQQGQRMFPSLISVLTFSRVLDSETGAEFHKALRLVLEQQFVEYMSPLIGILPI
jgi:hypothetical protein